jgi:hypothetical protein
MKRSGVGEADAVRVSEVLPFVEFDLQRQLMLKLKILGMNAAYGVTSKIQIGNNIIVATTTCTAFYVEALPPPPPLHISRNIKDYRGESETRLLKMQKDLESLCAINKATLDRYALTKKMKRAPRERDELSTEVIRRSHGGMDDSSTAYILDRSTHSSTMSSSSSSSSSSDDDDDSSLESPSSSSSSTSSDTVDLEDDAMESKADYNLDTTTADTTTMKVSYTTKLSHTCYHSSINNRRSMRQADPRSIR